MLRPRVGAWYNPRSARHERDSASRNQPPATTTGAARLANVPRGTSRPIPPDPAAYRLISLRDPPHEPTAAPKARPPAPRPLDRQVRRAGAARRRPGRRHGAPGVAEESVSGRTR